MESVTLKFNKYDLSEICSEYISQADPNHSVPPLPKYVGGFEVHLLLGIKNSGIAVYQSVFKDIWGSDLIFAGPHKLFTNGNKSSNANHVIFGIHSITSNFEDEQDDWSDERVYAMVADEELGLTVHPFPFNHQDILDVG